MLLPIYDHVVKYLLYIMNTLSKIEEAYYDYIRSEFGGWKWGNPDPIRRMKKGKFVKLVNVRIIEPSK